MNDLKTNKRIITLRKERNELLEEFLRIWPDPVIKGEITRGKINWRGLRLAVRRNNHIEQCWLEQRGEKISPIITTKITTFPFNLLRRKGDMQEKEIHPIELSNE